MTASEIDSADTTSRLWRGAEPGPIRIGSDEHRALFSRMLLDTFNPYKPAVIDWPKLDKEARDRLVSLPIWDIAVQTEGKASINVQSYAALVRDPLLRQAVELNGFEEGRHKTVLANLVQAYGIDIGPEPPYPPPRDPEWAFMKTGYSECIDSFFAFGLFEVARRSGYFPPELVATFEPVMQEEGRHITFFVNWAAWHRRNIPWWRRILFELKVMRVWAFLIWERMSIARGIGGKTEDANFTVTGSAAVGIDLSTAELLEVCLAENERRLSGYDTRLLRPKLVPSLVRLAHRLLRKREPGTVAIGSEAHKELFCRHFKATYQHYVPAELPWPELDEAALARLRAVPFWQEVLHTERRAGAIVAEFAKTVSDPLLREAIDLQGFEETRHAELLREMIRRYGIDASEQPLETLPADIETAFKDFGFGECMDSFLGFGVFKIAREGGFLPEKMFTIFEALMYEETRHIVFFINWMAYRQVQQGRSSGRRAAASLRFYTRAIKRLVGTARRGAQVSDGKNFSATQASIFLEGFTFRRFLEDCYAENARRMSAMEPGLLRPNFLPKLAEVALASLRLWSRDRRRAASA
jgi:hypothetical protein